MKPACSANPIAYVAVPLPVSVLMMLRQHSIWGRIALPILRSALEALFSGPFVVAV